MAASIVLRTEVEGPSYFYTRLQEVIALILAAASLHATDVFGRLPGGYWNTGGGIARAASNYCQLKRRPGNQPVRRSSYTYTNSLESVSQFADGTLQTPRICPYIQSCSAPTVQAGGMRPSVLTRGEVITWPRSAVERSCFPGLGKLGGYPLVLPPARVTSRVRYYCIQRSRIWQETG